MMAIGISFYLVFPTLFSVAYYLTSPSVQQSMQLESTQLTRFTTQSSAVAGSSGPTSPVSAQILDVESTMSSFWLLVLFYPSLIIAVVYATIQQLSSFLGGSYRNVGKVRGFV
jgi:hypothetical protein